MKKPQNQFQTQQKISTNERFDPNEPDIFRKLLQMENQFEQYDWLECLLGITQFLLEVFIDNPHILELATQNISDTYKMFLWEEHLQKNMQTEEIGEYQKLFLEFLHYITIMSLILSYLAYRKLSNEIDVGNKWDSSFENVRIILEYLSSQKAVRIEEMNKALLASILGTLLDPTDQQNIPEG